MNTNLQVGQSYADAEGNVRQIDAVEPGTVRYTLTKHSRHQGKQFVCSPKCFAKEYADRALQAPGQKEVVS